MKKRKVLSLIHERKHPDAVLIINLLLIALLGFLMVNCGPGEKLEIDLVKMDRERLEKELKNETEKSKRRVNILNELAYREERSGPKKPPEKDALDYVREAWNLAEELGYDKGFIESFCIYGRIYYLRSEYEKSFGYCKDGLTRASKIGWLRGQAMAYSGIARYYQVKGEYEKVLDHFIKSKEISERINEWRELSNANYGFGALLYYDRKDYSEALGYFEECLKLGKRIGDKTIISSGYYAVGVTGKGDRPKIRYPCSFNWLRITNIPHSCGVFIFKVILLIFLIYILYNKEMKNVTLGLFRYLIKKGEGERICLKT